MLVGVNHAREWADLWEKTPRAALLNARRRCRTVLISPAVSALEGLSSGILVGKYELLDGVENGHVAECWVARPRGRSRLVRLLRLKATARDDAESKSAFRQNLTDCERLDHPLIMRVIDIGEQDDDVFAAFEYDDTATLEELAGATRDAGEQVDVGIVLRVAMDIAAALAAAAHRARRRRGAR